MSPRHTGSGDGRRRRTRPSPAPLVRINGRWWSRDEIVGPPAAVSGVARPARMGARRIEDEADVREVIELMRLNYERVLG